MEGIESTDAFRDRRTLIEMDEQTARRLVNLELGSYLNKGNTGCVFDGKRGRAIKISCGLPSTWTWYETLLEKMTSSEMKSEWSVCCKVYDWDLIDNALIGEGKNKWVVEKVVWWVEMEKLYPISSSEGVELIRYWYDMYELEKGLESKKRDSILMSAIKDFYQRLVRMKKNGYLHLDFGPNNIMKDKFGRFKLVDLESIIPL